MSLRVLLLFSSSQIGGAERSLSRMALGSQDVCYHLATLDGEGPWTAWVRSQGHEPSVYGEKRNFFHPVKRLLKDIRERKPDIIYVCGLRASVLVRVLALFFPRVKVIHGVRWNPDSDSRLDRYFRLIEKYLHVLVDGWITNSKIAKNTLIQRCGIPAQKIHVVYNGIDLQPQSPRPMVERPKEVLTVANLSPRKGHKAYLRVIAKVVAQMPEARFIFVGRDDMGGAIQREIASLGLSQHVSCVGFQAETSPWYERARLMVLPSLWGEGCPTTILEAFAHGVPVLAYAIDGIPELIENGKDGFTIPQGNPQALANTLVALLEDPERLEIMATHARRKIEKNFTLAKSREKHLAAFRSFLSSPSVAKDKE